MTEGRDMKFIRLILRRPASVCLLIFSVILFGITSLTSMPLEYMPDMDMPMEMVIITWPGADSDSIERLVTEQVEDTCETLTDINTVSSTTQDNYTMVQLQYNYSVDLDDAYSELKAAMDNLKGDLPDGCDDPTIMEISMSSSATMSISATSSDGQDAQEFLEDTVVPKLESLAGVAKVDLSGSKEKYLRIVVDEAKMNQYGLSISSIGAAISAADLDLPVGSVAVGSQDIALSASGDIEVATPDFTSIPIQTASGQLIKLSDVTTFCNLYEEKADSISRYNGKPSVLLDVTKQNSASTISVCSDVKDTLDSFTADGVDFQVVSSEADNVKDSLMSVVETLLIGVALTMAVLFLFFGNLRASLIVGCSMPLSILLSMILLNAKGFAFDMMTGTSLVIAIGMIVDNSIVVLESCMRAQSRKADFKEAAAKGTGEVLLSIFASTLTTVVVYVPLAMADGMAGQMAGPLSWTISLTMLSSFVCAITVVPLVFSFVKPVAKENLPINRVLDQIKSFYRRVMPGMLRHPGRVLIAGIVILAASLALAGQMNFVLFPSDYDGSVKIDVNFRSGTKLEVMDQNIQSLEQALLHDPNFQNVTLDISGNTAAFTAYAKDNCKRTSEEAVEKYLNDFGSMPGMDVAVSPAGSDTSSMMDTGDTVDVTLASDNLDALEQGADLVQDAMMQVPGVIRVDNDFTQSRSQGRLVIDAQKAISAGTSQASVAMQVRYLLGGATVKTLDYGDKTYDAVLEYPQDKYADMTALMGHPIATQSGRLVTLEDIASIEYTTTLPSISRQDGQFITTVTATTTEAAKYTAGDGIKTAVAGLDFPDGVAKAQSAADKTSTDEISNMSKTLLTAVFLVFLVMAIQFDSPRLSIMIMLCIPFSLAGSFGFMFLAGRPMSIMGIMGFLMLFGIVVNNGILLVDATSQLRKTLPLEEALIQAGTTRLRPILMTTLTTVLSMVPMIFSTDSGMSMMKEMAYIIIGGLSASTVLTLFLMPPFYLIIRGERADGSKRKNG